MTPINLAIPESLTAQKAELESTLAEIATEEQILAAQSNTFSIPSLIDLYNAARTLIA
jgi:hypothetical protein